MECANR